VIVRLQTADHIRLASTVQEKQCPMATCDRTRIMRLAMGDAHDALSLLFQHSGGRIFSARLRPPEHGPRQRRRGRRRSIPKVSLAPSDNPLQHNGLPSF
jgi:hypothetical protein